MTLDHGRHAAVSIRATICPSVLDGAAGPHERLASSANGFASAMTRAFTQATVGGKQFDDVLSRWRCALSSLAVAQALKPIASGSPSAQRRADATVRRAVRAGGVRCGCRASAAIKPFAAGGVIGTPTIFRSSQRRAGSCRRSGPGGDRAAGARARRPARRRHERRRRRRPISPCRSRRPTPTASAARRPTSPARSRARWRAGSGVL